MYSTKVPSYTHSYESYIISPQWYYIVPWYITWHTCIHDNVYYVLHITFIIHHIECTTYYCTINRTYMYYVCTYMYMTYVVLHVYVHHRSVYVTSCHTNDLNFILHNLDVLYNCTRTSTQMYTSKIVHMTCAVCTCTYYNNCFIKQHNNVCTYLC